MLRKKEKDIEVDLIELSKDEICENDKKIWGYNPNWRQRTETASEDYLKKEEKNALNKKDIESENQIKDLKTSDVNVLDLDSVKEKEDIKNLNNLDSLEPKDVFIKKDYDLLDDNSDDLLDDDLLDEDINDDELISLEDESEDKTKASKRDKKSEKTNRLTAKKVIVRILLSVFTAIVLFVVGILGIVLIIEHGPSESAKNLFVNTVLETSAGKFLATSFLPASEIAKIKQKNSVELTDEITDTSLITNAYKADTADTGVASDTSDDIELIEINGGSYNGYILKVKDPSRVQVGTVNNFGGYGLHVGEIVENYGAVAGINGGGFQDDNGMGAGGTPIGFVISNGVFKYGDKNKAYDIAGFDKNNILVVGTMTGQQAIDRGIRDCCFYGPTLIVNGEPTLVNGSGSGINPRTAIGQCADGSVLLLVIDGRQINSIGATFADVIEVMLEYGAVNAYNLDGGSSTVLYYNGEYVNSASPLTGSRLIPTAFIVK
ncbi:phosphodiester glycosidase family protein [Lachnospira multipara]|uniref:phosphodiester glycosidase family protein n=1 Tax=Lachnospira multipara TaxID=28051 RepID=UPI000688BECC|nr:phosphodiester glycosidase family protein [Lachnospira multipara]